jgi:hypothetical protein
MAVSPELEQVAQEIKKEVAQEINRSETGGAR